jgi:hypothetical protein
LVKNKVRRIKMRKVKTEVKKTDQEVKSFDLAGYTLQAVQASKKAESDKYTTWNGLLSKSVELVKGYTPLKKPTGRQEKPASSKQGNYMLSCKEGSQTDQMNKDIIAGVYTCKQIAERLRAKGLSHRDQATTEIRFRTHVQHLITKRGFNVVNVGGIYKLLS